ncbi:transglutaminase-like domain-containing protein [Streptomyces sp. SL13]|jgi:transglutaminase-like putative cysteine protease|uniref:Transglutaminase-like domain-containing protein n=1 Tax=Streptantibioticus silvisoli TaxID=2705255 RepID=A0AA90HA79_9ACTN|nr:transglutaminase-like domain-containing protein [Streptantibioticus silvisoli]MDI5964583.1 transglutaminase-like domain-containing protein [Streptantibioticus silvisoli]MDI5970912.1 transglutaminase-like domain-containing protein [Streptantibioticus silvisoli]
MGDDNGAAEAQAGPATGASLAATEFLDHRSEQVEAFVGKALAGLGGAGSDTDKAIALYYAVRDGIDYEVYGADLTRFGLSATGVLEKGFGFCVHKSILYATALRSVGIPSRVYYGDVRNHLASPRLRELVGGDVFRFHSLTVVQLEDQWVKATPVFNKLLCRLYKIKPLDFDGRSDSLYHPFDETGRQHMEFIHEHGSFDDVPYDLVVDGIRQAHPLLFASAHTTVAGSLAEEAAPAAT